MRDSSRMRTKSLRIDSSVSCSTMCVPVAPPAKPGRDHGLAERLQRARDVDALAARHRALFDGAVAAPEPEVRHRERLVDRRVERDRDDHRWLRYPVRGASQRPHGLPRSTTHRLANGPSPREPPALSGARGPLSARAALARRAPAASRRRRPPPRGVRGWAVRPPGGRPAMLREAVDQPARAARREGRREVLHAARPARRPRAAGRSRCRHQLARPREMLGLGRARSPPRRRSSPPRRRRPRRARSTIAASRSHTVPPPRELRDPRRRAAPGFEVRTSTSTPAPARAGGRDERLRSRPRPSAG